MIEAKQKRLLEKGEVIKRSVVEETAMVMGKNSAAARALEHADCYDEDVRFWRIREDRVIVVERRPTALVNTDDTKSGSVDR